jgi:hypothetical protein
VLFGEEDILINNIAWALRTLPVFGTTETEVFGCSPSMSMTLLQPQFAVLKGKLMRRSMPSVRKHSTIADLWK